MRRAVVVAKMMSLMMPGEKRRRTTEDGHRAPRRRRGGREGRRDTIRISLFLVDGRKCETCCGERVAHPKARGMKLERGAITNAHDVEVDWTTGHWTCKDLGDMAAYQKFLLSSPLAGFPRLASCDIALIVSDTQRV